MAINFYSDISLNYNELQNIVVQKLGSAPGSPVEGQIYYDTGDDTIYVRRASDWLDLGQSGSSVSGNTFATDLKIGRDADNLIDFTTDNQITFRVSAGNNVIMKASGEIEAASLDISGDVDVDGTLETDAFSINGTAVTSTAAELNALDGITSTVAELNILDGVTSTAAELNILDGVTSTTAELNTLDGITAVVGELNHLDLGSTAVGTAIASKAVVLDSNKDYTGFRNITLSGELDAGSLDVSGDVDIDGTLETDALSINGTAVSSTAAELNILDGVTSTTAELNVLDGITAVVGELNALDIGSTAVGTAVASKAVILDSNKDYTGVRNLTISGELDAATGDFSGAVDIAGDLTLSAGADGALTFGAASSIKIVDNQAASLVIEEADTAYMTFTTTNSSELITANKGFNIAGAFQVGGTAVTSTAAELNILDGVTSTAAELNILDGVTSTAAELNILDGVTSTAAELNILDGVTSTAAELNALDGITAVVGELNALDIGSTAVGTAVASKAVILDSNKDYTGVRNFTITGNLSVGGTTTQVNTVTMNAQNAVVFEGATADNHETTLTIVDPTADHTYKLPDLGDTNDEGYIAAFAADPGTSPLITSTPTELNLLDGVTSTTAELNILDGVTSTAAELNILDGVTSTAAELNILDGVTSTAAELNVLDGITAVVGELNALDIGSTAVGTAVASKAVILDSNKDYTGIRNLTVSGEYDGATLDLSGAADIAGDLVLSGGADGALQFTNAGENSIKIPDNQASALIIEEADNAYMTFATTNSSELITANKAFNAAGTFSIGGTAVTSTAAELNILDGVTSTAAELNILDGVTSTAAELNILDGVTSTAAELNILDGVTSTAAELNILDGVTSTAAELNALDGITAVVGELNALDIGSTAVGTAVASKAVILDSNKDYTGLRNITLSGELDAGSLDVSGDADIDGTLETDALTINGTAIVAQATASAVGGVELATADEVITGTDAARVVTCDTLSAKTVVGIIDVSSLTGDKIVTIPHNLGTADVIVQMYDTVTEHTIYADIGRTDDNMSTASTANVSVDFGATDPPNDIRVIITSLAGASASGTVAYT